MLYNVYVVHHRTTTEVGMDVLERELSRTFSALADPTRRAMLGRLAASDATVNELAAPFAMSQQAISRHVKVLEQAGLISRSRASQSRPCHLEVDRLDVVAEWVRAQHQVWEERYDRLDRHLATLQDARARDEGSGRGRRR
jgi:DNA-binding transcriptional ArsR family regulator